MWPALNSVKSAALRLHNCHTFLEAVPLTRDFFFYHFAYRDSTVSEVLVFAGSVLLSHVSRRYVIRVRCCGEFSPSPEDVVIYHINNVDLV